MLKLKLGTYLLPPGEVVLIRTLVRLFSQDNAFHWTFSSMGPYDALIVDSDPPAANGVEPVPSTRAVLKLTSANTEPSAHTLQRPVKAEKLQEWLKIIAEALRCPNESPATASTVTAPHLLAMKQARFKLLRWPPAALLQNDPNLIRMSSLLSRRALQLPELAELSHQSVDACMLFIEQLLPMKLIACESMESLRGTSFAVLQPSIPTPAKIPFHRSLISGIRKRLGL